MSVDVASNTPTIESVRKELKQWEWQFKQAHGRKPGRDDVKNDATISAKYEEYDRLSGRVVKTRGSDKLGTGADGKDDRRALKERSTNLRSATPKKALKNPTMIAEEASFDDHVEEQQPTPACIRLALGPTPQKDGAILGLFDVLPAASPSKGAQPSETIDPAIFGTPSKLASFQTIEAKETRTPQSSAKRYYLDAFGGTPLKRKREDDNLTPSTTKKRFATPAFLRRSHVLAPIGEDGNESSSLAGPPFKKRGLVRSLSTIIQGLRKQEEERLEDDWDVLNEIEAEERGESVRPTAPKVLVDESQSVEMPLGPDQGAPSDEESDGQGNSNSLDAAGRPRKAWKKKGLKRQTRRVIMRPVLHQPKKAVKGNSDDEDDSVRVDPASDSESVLQPEQPTKRPKARPKSKNAESKDDNQKSKKKASSLAHTNFRKLKIKNKNSKANGRGRKFGRR